jgi:predicted O-methyltransferase YrrM
MLWQEIRNTLSTHAETGVHPHVRGERPELFKALDVEGSTELDYLDLIWGLVRSRKPFLSLETGTFHGYGTLAIASALKENNYGRVVTVDTQDCPLARELVTRFGLVEQVEFVTQLSRDYIICQPDDKVYNFAFLDSDVSCRAEEFYLLDRFGHLDSYSVCAIHDTSRKRLGVATSFEFMKFLDALRGIEFPLGRGLVVWSGGME